ncbi:MAG: 50S ribosomal protein L21e [Sulfolobales archaeon]
MVKASQGLRHRTRKLLRKNVRERGAIPRLSLVMQEYRAGDRVHIAPNPAIHEALPHRRYIGKTGIVVGKRGRAYLVELLVGSKKKVIITVPEHLIPAQGGS